MKNETRALLDKARQSVQAAESLKRDGFRDFAASRAYYAMFYVAEALLIEEGLSYVAMLLSLQHLVNCLQRPAAWTFASIVIC